MNNMELALSPVFLPLAGAAMALLSKSIPRRRLATFLELCGALTGLFLPWLTLAALLPVVMDGGISFTISGWNATLGIAQRFDGLAWLVDALGFMGAGLAYLYSRGAGPRGPHFTAIFLIQTAALAATASTADLFNLFVCLEVLGIASYVLVASARKPGAYLAAFSYLAISSAAMVFFLVGLFGFYRLTGSLSYASIAQGLGSLNDGGGPVASLSSACIVAAIAIRVAVMPVYGWLPDAHALAPHAVSAVLSGVLIKTPLFALGRLLAFLPSGQQAMNMVGVAGVITALAAVIVALSQSDAKRLLAYHSISQIGYIVAAWGLGTAAGLQAAYMHALYHAIFKGLLFLSIGTITDAAGNRNVYTLRGAGSALIKAGDKGLSVGVSYAIGALSICALPPFNGFASKNAIGHLFKGSWAYWVLFAAGVCTVASFLKLSMIFLPAHGENAQEKLQAKVESDQAPEYRIHCSMKSALLILAGLCVASGLLAGPLGTFTGRLLGVPFLGVKDVIYSASALIKTAITVVLGMFIFGIAISPPGKKLATAIRGRPRSFAGLVLAFISGLAALGARLVFFR